ncbi:(Na+)-NQR maturation NqrM [Arsukibacterium sp.]|uniref:(Na+)-NQR maturation NqrM n=1 Tax=Arsukibacterium sp. TaxID=1977258 RepID=UPI00299E299D|nr:(Na+)-NQR maturation NqrM [Arsukibacterium sp.]MDX1676374.1 (Na+)-NQR maturation NqrM [Arsukibacterium sp.]
MAVFIFTFGLFLVVVCAMAIGFIVQRKTIAGSCGGLGDIGVDKACDCDKPCEKRLKRQQKEKFWQDNKII